METKVQIVIMSHLSDVQELQSLCRRNADPSKVVNAVFSDAEGPIHERASHKLNFVKFLILRYPNTLDKINPDKEYEDFIKKHPNL